MSFETKHNITANNAEGVKTFFSGDKAIFCFGDGAIYLDDRLLVTIADGIYDAALCPISFGIISLGDDAKIIRTRLNGQQEIIAHFENDFADFLAVNSISKTLAVALTKKIVIIDLKDNQILFEFEPPMSPNCISFDKMGANIVVGHGKGMTVYDLKTNEAPLDFKAQGGVYASEFSPNLRFIVASTGEPAMVGWKLTDGSAFRMAGYPTKASSLAWVGDGAALLTSGAPLGILWPFFSENGPIGSNAKTLQTRNAIVSAVAAGGDYIALGHNDGGVDIICNQDDEMRNIGGSEPDLNAKVDFRAGNTRVVSVAFSNNAKFVSHISESGVFGKYKI